ncbi:MAG: NapC/NirT family cytochrome c [Candidatus Solibacter usitatus]|nr:NapC/NirT family cytochrome c [Candidatus Solibacter usitatus]
MKFKQWLAPLVYLASNWISLIGVVLVTTAGILWILLIPSTMRGGHASGPYIGILQFMMLPAVFFAGLALIPLGMWWFKKRNKGKLPERFPPLDFDNPRFRRLLAFLGATTVANLVIGGSLTYKAVAYMESVNFCGQTCHVVMKPEFTAYQNSPHSRVECVSCHIGPGANWFVKSKISGSWQVISVSLNLYPRPIPTPIENLRPARETCEVCHWPQKYGGDRLRIINSFTDDERPKLTRTVLLMHIGGGNGYEGIHGAHMGPGVEVRYAPSDKQRQKIPWVEYTGKEGKKFVFKADGYKDEGPGNMDVRTMDCMDCHNRPSHTYELPERALNKSMAAGELDLDLPFVRKAALEVLKQKYATTQESEREIVRRFKAYYEKNYPDLARTKAAGIDRSARAVLAVYGRNVFPEMNVNWGSYPNNIGHTDFDGCFRCHDERPSTAGGRTIPQDCETCHKMLAQDEEAPKVLTDLGLGHAWQTGLDKGK